jgi:hypothetical protein
MYTSQATHAHTHTMYTTQVEHFAKLYLHSVIYISLTHQRKALPGVAGDHHGPQHQ